MKREPIEDEWDDDAPILSDDDDDDDDDEDHPSDTDDNTSAFRPRRRLPAPEDHKYTLKGLMRILEERQGSRNELMLDLEPEYQRDVVWKRQQMSALINSIIENYYIPPLIFNLVEVDIDGKLYRKRVCVDGKQRLSSVRSFVNGEIPCHDHNGDSWYFCNKKEFDAAGKRTNRKILPEDVREQFLSKQFICYEYQNLSPMQEEDLFARVQKGVPLNPAEKLRATSGPWQDFAKGFEREYANVVNLSTGKAVERAGQFRLVLACFAQIIEVQHPTNADGIPRLRANANTLSTFIENKAALTPDTRVHLTKVFDKFSELIDLNPQTFKDNDYTSIKTFSPIDMISVAVLISEYMDTRNSELLLGDIRELRTHLRRIFRDLRTHAPCWNVAWKFIENLESYRGVVQNSTPPAETVKVVSGRSNRAEAFIEKPKEPRELPRAGARPLRSNHMPDNPIQSKSVVAQSTASPTALETSQQGASILGPHINCPVAVEILKLGNYTLEHLKRMRLVFDNHPEARVDATVLNNKMLYYKQLKQNRQDGRITNHTSSPTPPTSSHGSRPFTSSLPNTGRSASYTRPTSSGNAAEARIAEETSSIPSKPHPTPPKRHNFVPPQYIPSAFENSEPSFDLDSDDEVAFASNATAKGTPTTLAVSKVPTGTSSLSTRYKSPQDRTRRYASIAPKSSVHITGGAQQSTTPPGSPSKAQATLHMFRSTNKAPPAHPTIAKPPAVPSSAPPTTNKAYKSPYSVSDALVTNTTSTAGTAAQPTRMYRTGSGNLSDTYGSIFDLEAIREQHFRNLKEAINKPGFVLKPPKTSNKLPQTHPPTEPVLSTQSPTLPPKKPASPQKASAAFLSTPPALRSRPATNLTQPSPTTSEIIDLTNDEDGREAERQNLLARFRKPVIIREDKDDIESARQELLERFRAPSVKREAWNQDDGGGTSAGVGVKRKAEDPMAKDDVKRK